MTDTATATPGIASVLVYTYEDTVGDGLVKLPFVRELRRRLPEATVTWCAGVGPCAYADALAPLTGGLIDEVIARAGIGRNALGLLDPRPPLGGRRFDLVIDTQRAVHRALAARRIRHGVFVSAALGFRLSDRRPPPGHAWPRHLVAGLTALLGLAVPPRAGAPLPEVPIDAARAALADELLPEGPVYVGLAPGAGDPAKVWPLENFIAVARAQADRGRVPVFLLGPAEAPWLPEIRAAVPEARFPEAEDAARDRGGPLLAIALARRLAAAVANDSGAGHMLAAGGAPLVSLFSKHDPAKYTPSAEPLVVLDSKEHGGADPALIPVAAVTAALDRLVAGRG